MRVSISRYKLGGFIFKPVNESTVKSFHKDMIENGCNPNDCKFDLLLHYEDIMDFVSNAKFKDLDSGFTITCNLDSWLVRQYFGYCCG